MSERLASRMASRAIARSASARRGGGAGKGGGSWAAAASRVSYCVWLLAAALLLATRTASSGGSAREARGVGGDTASAAGAAAVLLENGSTVVVLTLEEFLAQTTERVELATRDKQQQPAELLAINGSSQNQLEREEEPVLSSTSLASLSATNDSNGANARLAGEKQADQLRGQPTTRVEKHDRESDSKLESGAQSTSASSEEAKNHSVGASQHQEVANEHHRHKQHGATTTTTTTTGVNSTKPIPQHWQVRSLLNVTHDYPLAYSQIICGYVWPLMAGITLFTNLMIVFVLTQRDMRTPTNVVLTAIAIADIIPIVVPVPWFVYLFAMDNEKQVLYPPIACYFYQHSTRSISEVFYFLSTWLNVLLAVQDYLTACKPQLAQKYCQIRVVVIEIILLTFLAFLLNLPQALKIVFKPVKFYYRGQLTWGCKALQAKWFKDLVGEYVALYDDIFTAIIVLFVDGGPAIALITLTALLIRQLQRQRIQGHLLMEQARTASKRRRERHRQQESEASARVMIFVLLAFLAVKIPFATTYTLMIIQSRFEIHFVENLVDFQKAITLTDLVFVLSYPINFTIFCCCSKKFRHKCAQLLGECNANTKSARNRIMRSFSASYDDACDGLDDSTLSQLTHEQQHKRHSSAATLASIKAAPMDKERPDNVQCLPTANGDIGSRRLAAAPPPSCTNSNSNGKICDGLGHFEPADLRWASLDEGGICMECVMRYERMKRLHQNRLISEEAAAVALQRRRSSQDSTSWPIGPPPPPPPLGPLRTAQQLPAIITTVCDSINEQPSSEEASSAEKGQQRQPQLAAAADRLDWPVLPVQQNRGRLLGETESRATSSIVSSELDVSQLPVACESRGRRSSTSRSHDGRFVDAAVGCEPELLDESLAAAAAAASTSARASKRRPASPSRKLRGLGEGLFGLKQLSDFLRRSSDNSDDRPSEATGGGGGGGADKGKLSASNSLDVKGRSLSLSDSKMTTLPNATGMLADIMMSTLLTAPGSSGGGGQRAGGGSDDGRGVVSEPPISLASGGRKREEDEERYLGWRQAKRQRSFREAASRR